MSVKLHKAKEFDRRFWQLVNEYPTYEQAYEAVEKEYKQSLQDPEPKYKNYESYRKSRERRIKSKAIADI